MRVRRRASAAVATLTGMGPNLTPQTVEEMIEAIEAYKSGAVTDPPIFGIEAMLDLCWRLKQVEDG